MPIDEMGEIGGIDLSFEDLEFIEADLGEEEILENEENTEGKTEQPSGSAEEGETTEGQETSEQEASEEVKDNDETTEGESSERVSGDSTEGNEDDEESSPQLYRTLADTLIEKGVLTSVDDSSLEGIKSIDDFVEVMKQEIKAQELNDLTEAQKELLKGIREGASSETASKFKDAMDKLGAIDQNIIENNENVRKDLIFQKFLAKGFDKDEAAKQVERSFKVGEDKEDALTALTELRAAVKQRYEYELDADKRKAEEYAKTVEKQKEELKERILKEKEVFKGIEVPDNVRKEVYEEMMEQVSINPETKAPENSLMKYQRENPQEFSHKLYYLWKVSNGFKDLDYFNRKTTTSSVKKLEKAIKQSAHVFGGGDPNYTDDINTGLLDIEDIVIPE